MGSPFPGRKKIEAKKKGERFFRVEGVGGRTGLTSQREVINKRIIKADLGNWTLLFRTHSHISADLLLVGTDSRSRVFESAGAASEVFRLRRPTPPTHFSFAHPSRSCLLTSFLFFVCVSFDGVVVVRCLLVYTRSRMEGFGL